MKSLKRLSIVIVLMLSAQLIGQTGVKISDLNPITASTITDDTLILFGTANLQDTPATPRKLSLADLKQAGDVRKVATVAAMQAVTNAKDNQRFMTDGYSVEGVGANLYRYDAASAATADGGFVITATGMGVGRYIAVDQTVADVTKFGAVGDGVADDTAAIQAAIDSGVNVFLPKGHYIITSTLTVTGRTSFLGSGYDTRIHASSITGNAIQLGDGSTLTWNLTCGNFRISGNVTSSGLRVNNVQHCKIDRIWFDGLTCDVACFMKFIWGSEIHNLWTNGATVATSCISCGASFNANTCANWYTSNLDAPINILLDMSLESGVTTSKGNSFNNICPQGGDIGLWVRRWNASNINGIYTENVVTAVKFGDQAAGQVAYGISVNGAFLAGPAISHPSYANRVACLELDYCYGIQINGAEFAGAFNAATWAPITFTGGGGTGARAFARVTAAGVVQSIVVVNPGSGYTSDPTISIGGAGSGATATATRSGTVVASVAVTDGGSGYIPVGYCPVAIRYGRCNDISIGANFLNTGIGVNSPLYPWLVRTSTALSDASVKISDQSLRNSDNGNSADLLKSQGYAYRHYLIEYNSSGSQVVTEYIPPVFP